MRAVFFGLICLAGAVALHAAEADGLVSQALEAEGRFDSRRALDLFLAADRLRPDDPFILQKIARQYSDLGDDLPAKADKIESARKALGYAERAVRLNPRSAVNVLSLAICHGKLAVWSDARTKIAYSRLVKEEAERALALDPNYAWAHHVLGRWNYEVASLGPTARFFVRLLYGGLPDASYDRGIAELSRAVELEPGQLCHRLELGMAYLAAGRKAEARAEFVRGLAMPCVEKFDAEAKERAATALTGLAGAAAGSGS